jgi:hypothetical protein
MYINRVNDHISNSGYIDLLLFQISLNNIQKLLIIVHINIVIKIYNENK